MQFVYVLILGLFLGLMTVQGRGENITLAEEGRSDYTIVVSKNASLSEKHAAQELSNFLSQISGAQFPIVKEGKWSQRK